MSSTSSMLENDGWINSRNCLCEISQMFDVFMLLYASSSVCRLYGLLQACLPAPCSK